MIPSAIAGIGYTTPNAQTEGAGLGCAQILVADLNSDGRPDIVVYWEGYQASIEILRNDGDFQFTDITPQAMGGYAMDFEDAQGAQNSPGHFALLDLNGDGTLDLVSKIAADDIATVLSHTAFLNDRRCDRDSAVRSSRTNQVVPQRLKLSFNLCSKKRSQALSP